MRKAVAVFFLLVAGRGFAATGALEKGEELFLNNKPAEALPLLEEALNEDPANENVYLYLGTADQQLGDYDKAIAVLKKGLAVATLHKDLMYFDMGNDYFSKGQFTFADQMYSGALDANPALADALLNRANARMKLQSYADALSDYTVFLQLRPQDSQRPQIQAVMGLIAQTMAAQEQQKKDAEAKQKALMNEVMSSLNNASEDTKNLSVQSLQFKDESADVDIKD